VFPFICITNKFIQNLSISLFLFFSIVINSFSQDLTKLIPSSSSGVFTFDAGYFFKKVDLQQIQRLEMFQDLDEQNQLRNKERHKHISKIYKAPESIGVNLNSKWYLFMDHSEDTTLWGTRSTFYGLLIPLSNSSKFENFYKKISDSTIHKRKGYKYSMLGYSQMIAWNKSNIIILFSSSYSEDAIFSITKELDKITHLTNEQCLKSNKNFCDAQLGKFDFHYWMHFGSLFSGMNLAKYAMLFPGFKNLPFTKENFYKDYYLHFSLNFDNGSIHINSKQFLSKESAQQVDNLYGKGINKDLIKYIHKDYFLGSYAFSMNMNGIKSMIDTMVTDSLKEKLNQGFVEGFYEDYFKKDKQLTKLNLELDSMYADLYPKSDTNSYNYNNYNDDYDTTSYSSDYDSNNYNTDTSSYASDYDAIDTTYNFNNYSDTATYTTPSNEESIVDTAVVVPPGDYSNDSTNYEYPQTYYSEEDSIYELKRKRIQEKNKEIKTRTNYLANQKIKELNIQKNDILELFKGDVLMVLSGFHFIPKKYKSYEYDEEEYKTIEVEKVKNDPFPEFTIGLTVNNKTKLESLLNGFVKDSLLKQHKNYYYTHSTKGDSTPTIYLALSGEVLLITSEVELVTTHLNGYSSENRISKEVEDLITNKTLSVYVSLKDIFARLPYNNLSAQRAELYTMLMNSFTTTYLTAENSKSDTSSSDFVFNFTNKLDNSLFEILRLFNESYKINRGTR